MFELVFPLLEQIQRGSGGEVVEVEGAKVVEKFFGGVGEEVHLVVLWAAAGGFLADVVDGELAEEFFGTGEDGFGDAGQTRDVDAVAAVGAAFDDSVQENHLVLPFSYGDI